MRTLILASLLLVHLAGWGEDWSRFRGANGSGVASGSGFPNELRKSGNAVWRTPVRPGKSSPILTARHVVLTGFSDGKLYTQCFDRQSGKLLWERAVPKASEMMANRLNHPAGISSVADGENIISFFKDYGFVSYDAAGNLRWQTPMGPSPSQRLLAVSVSRFLGLTWSPASPFP